MRNAVSLLKHYCPGPLVSRRIGLVPAVVAAWFLTGLVPSATVSSHVPVLNPQFSAPLPLPGRPSPAHARLFTPRGAPEGSYVVTVLGAPMETARLQVMRALGVPDAPATGMGPWAVRRLEVTEAFGSSGIYDETRLGRLFNGRRAFVTRGPVTRNGAVVASVTLISPYPDPTLSRLEPGTLAILFDVHAARGRVTFGVG